MPITLVEGKLMCSNCGRLMEKGEAFKLNDYRYQVYCLDCFSEIEKDPSENSPILYQTHKILELIKMYEHANKTASISLNSGQIKLFDAFQSKSNQIPVTKGNNRYVKNVP